MKFLVNKMGWVSLDSGKGESDWATGETVVHNFDPMNCIEHAWMVVEWMINNGHWLELSVHKIHVSVSVWTLNDGLLGVWIEETVPKAICNAAVKALATETQREEWGL